MINWIKNRKPHLQDWYDSTIWKILDKNWHPEKTTVDQKELSHISPQKYLNEPQDFGENILWSYKSWHFWSSLESRRVWRKQTWWWYGVRLGLLSCFRIWMTFHDWCNHEVCSLSENAEREYPRISVCVFLAYSAELKLNWNKPANSALKQQI